MKQLEIVEAKEWERPSFMQPPPRMSIAASTFYGDLYGTLHFLHFTTDLPRRLDELAATVAEVLVGVSPNHPDRPKWDRMLADRDATGKRLLSFAPLFMEMLLCRITDNFLAYISDLVTLILKAKPETLRSSWGEDPVKVSEILDFASRDDLLAAIIERRVGNLSQRGMKYLNRTLDEQIGFAVFPDDEQFLHAQTIIETRNLVVHKRGVADERFVRKVSGAITGIGHPVKVEAADVLDAMGFLSRSVAEIDIRACAKFGIKRSVPRKRALQSARSRDRKGS